MWRDSISKRRARYMYLLKESALYHDTAAACLESTQTGNLSKREKIMRDVSICVLAPAINSFAIWVLKAALKKKISRLYFLARDGYFMYTTAKQLCERFQLPVECRYLSCSRYSVRIPMFHFNMSEAFDYIVRGGIDVTLDKVLNRAGLSEEDKVNVIRDIGDEFVDGVIPYADLPKLRTRLEASDVFFEAVKKRSEAAFPKARAYFNQEGLFEDISYAFVDSGWTGSMQKVIGQLLEKCGQKRKLHGFYWGLYELPPDVNTEDYECFYFGPTWGFKRKVGFSNCLFESIFSAPHGMTLRYEQSGEEVSPVYADIRVNNKRFNEETKQYLDEFTEKLCDLTGRAGYSLTEAVYRDKERVSGSEYRDDKASTDLGGGDVKNGYGGKLILLKGICSTKQSIRTIEALLNTFMGVPARHEAAVYGSLPFSDDVLDENEQQVAARMTQDELKTNYPLKKILIMTGMSKERIKESAWYEGSAVRSGEDVDRHLRAYRMYKRLLYGKKELMRVRSVLSAR